MLSLATALQATACPGMGEVMRLYGYTEVLPPSKFYAPGSMMWVRGNKPFHGGVICPASASLGPRFVPRASPTAALELSHATEHEFFLDTSFLTRLRADGRFRRLHNVRIKLDNPVLFEVTDTDVLRNLRARSAECRHALAMRRNNGFRVTMVAAALRADVTYTVEWTHEVGGSVGGAETLDALAAELGAEHAIVSDRTIVAHDLYWGIKDDAYLAQMGEGRSLLEMVGSRRIIEAAATIAPLSGSDVAEVLDLPDTPPVL